MSFNVTCFFIAVTQYAIVLNHRAIQLQSASYRNYWYRHDTWWYVAPRYIKTSSIRVLRRWYNTYRGTKGIAQYYCKQHCKAVWIFALSLLVFFLLSANYQSCKMVPILWVSPVPKAFSWKREKRTGWSHQWHGYWQVITRNWQQKTKKKHQKTKLPYNNKLPTWT